MYSYLDYSMRPANIFVASNDYPYGDNYRKWQTAPSIEVTDRGRVYIDYYAGDAPEVSGNYVVIIVSENQGKDFLPLRIIVQHPNAEIRLFDPNLWIDPLNRLWIIWNQSRGFHDGRIGVWASVCPNPDDSPNELCFSPPKRVANGIMINKPTVLSSGEWIFPCAIWNCEQPSEDHGLQKEFYSNVYISTDNGESFHLQGHADIPNRSFDEHMIVEKKDKRLWMLVRSFDGIGESYSSDKGVTWSDGVLSSIDGPCSRFHIRRLHSGRLLLVNHYKFEERIDLENIRSQGPVKSWRGRTNLTALLSEDDGSTWPFSLLLDPRNDAAYPDAKEASDGFIYITHDWERVKEGEIILSRITEDDILNGKLVNPGSYIRKTVNKAQGNGKRSIIDTTNQTAGA